MLKNYLKDYKTYWGKFSHFNRQVVEDYIKLNQSKLILIDGGAAGNLSEPFDISKQALLSIRFEPRGEQEVSMSKEQIYINGGLWIKDDEKKLHIAQEPTTSSIYPPNIKFLKTFNDKNGIIPRTTKSKKKNTFTLDRLVR